MAENTSIEWAHHTFNLWWGCQEVSPGCENCYARDIAKRFHPRLKLWDGQRLSLLDSDGKRRAMNMPYTWNNRAAKRGERYRIFVQSMGDVFDNHGNGRTLEDERQHLWTMIRKTPNLDWLLLTKRIGNAAKMLPPDLSRMPHVWIGASVVNQAEADRDIPKLLSTPAAVRFLSCEPLLDDVDLTGFIWGRQQPCPECPQDVDCDCGGTPTLEIPNEPAISWVIVGGESGPKARPMHPDWARSLRDQCAAAGVPFFFKQHGEWAPNCLCDTEKCCAESLRPKPGKPGFMFRCGKKSAGRLLDGREHSEFPA